MKCTLSSAARTRVVDDDAWLHQCCLHLLFQFSIAVAEGIHYLPLPTLRSPNLQSIEIILHLLQYKTPLAFFSKCIID